MTANSSQFNADDSEKATSRVSRVKLTIAVVLLSAIGFAGWRYGHLLSLESLADKESQMRAYQSDHPILVFAIAFVLYVAVTGLSLPGAAALTLVFGWYFGFWQALLIVSFASTTGATIAFLSSRFLLRDSVQAKFGKRLKSFNEHLERDGPFYLFTLRLIPAVPFFVINLVMGLTPIRTRTYWWISQLGMLPGTVVYTYAGSRVPNLTELAEHGASAVFTFGQLVQIFGAFALLGFFPLIVRKLMAWFAPNRAAEIDQ